MPSGASSAATGPSSSASHRSGLSSGSAYATSRDGLVGSSPPLSSTRTLSPAHRTPTPLSPQDTFGQHSPMSEANYGLMASPLAVPEPAVTPSPTSTRRAPSPADYPVDAQPEPGPSRARTPEAPRPLSPDSDGHSTTYLEPGGFKSGRSSWQFNSSPSGSSAAIAVARRQRVSQAPPLPEKPYHAPPSQRPMTPTAATTLLAATASTMQSPTTASHEGRPVSLTQSINSARSRKSRFDPSERYAAVADTIVPPPPAGLATAVAAGEVPRYSFLDHDPAVRAESPAYFSGYANAPLPRRVSEEVPSSARKHLSVQSAFSEPYGASSPYESEVSAAFALDSMSNADSDSPSRSNSRAGASAPYAQFAGGPPPTWGRRDSARSARSLRSRAGSTKSRKRRSKPGTMPTQDEGDDDFDLYVLAKRAAVLERLLRAGKRASALAGNPKAIHRWSGWSTSTHVSSPTSRQASSRNGHRGQTPTGGRASPPHRSVSAASGSQNGHQSPRRSGNSTGSTSLRTRFQRRFGLVTHERQFHGLGSDDEDIVELNSQESFGSIHTPQTPIRHAFSTSFSHRDATPPPGAGAGIIVFPELATLSTLEGPKRDGEVCAQACLPPSVAVPYKPLPPPPPAAAIATKSSRQFSKFPSGGSRGSFPDAISRSLHSLKNLRGYEEKPHVYTHAGNGMRESVASGTVLIGDVPMCEEHVSPCSSRRTQIVLAVLCLMGIILIAGLLGGLLGRNS